ncbi:hypothetical protein Q3G72_009594 [Acer saccharum]|nr:hypothetical protein Q3G72_018468 [Acer saccharum]KAK1581845.1 hypothetical protein Q3G72_009594 [Acer saccharum]
MVLEVFSVGQWAMIIVFGGSGCCGVLLMSILVVVLLIPIAMPLILDPSSDSLAKKASNMEGDILNWGEF